MMGARRTAGWVALVAYLVCGALLYLSVLPGADWHWPPDFRLMGYTADSIAGFTGALRAEGLASYGQVLAVWDRVFVVAFAAWLILTGWRGGWMRYAVAFLAVVYAGVDLGENAAIARMIGTSQDTWVEVASHLTMAKFSSLYLCALVLLVHLRWAR